ncbi:MAG TPA: hypothetical protein VIM48_01085 [Chthoniobacterales bacterium]
MKRFAILIVALLAAADLRAQAPAPSATPSPTPSASPSPSTTPDPAADNPENPQARSATLDLAGAFSNDGYKIRDGYYFSTLEPGKSAVIEVNLFAGNEYWFCVAANPPAKGVTINVFDEKGTLVSDQQYYADGPKAAAGIVAPTSGRYLVKITLSEGEKSSFCFLYCYK